MANANTRVKDIIQERGLSYGDIAREIGVTPQAVYAIVTGRAVGATGRYAVAKVLGMEVDDLWPAEAETVA